MKSASTMCIYSLFLLTEFLLYQLLVWNHSSLSPVQTYMDHLAAVKAIAWSPHQHGLLASGGGTADRCIRFWNTLTSQPLQCMDTGSQVCNLAWSKHANELVSASTYIRCRIHSLAKYIFFVDLQVLTQTSHVKLKAHGPHLLRYDYIGPASGPGKQRHSEQFYGRRSVSKQRAVIFKWKLIEHQCNSTFNVKFDSLSDFTMPQQLHLQAA